MSASGTVYAGVTRWRGAETVEDALSGVFRLRAGDGATDWEHLTRGLPEGCHVPCVAVHPTDPTVVYAGTDSGPYRSTDGGARWARMPFPREDRQVWSFAFHPADPRRMIAGTSPLGIFLSEDGGETWREAPSARRPDRMPMGDFRNRVLRIAHDPANPREIYAALEVNGVIRSLDGGETWEDCSEDLIRISARPERKSAILTKSDAEGMLDAHAIAVSAAAPGQPVLAVRMGLFRSADRARHWEDLEVGRFSPITYGRDIRVSPHDPRVLYACLSTAAVGPAGSVYRSDDLGRSWRRFDRGVEPSATMMAVAPHPRDADAVYAATRFGQVFGTRDGGATWAETPLPAGCRGVFSLAVG